MLSVRWFASHCTCKAIWWGFAVDLDGPCRRVGSAAVLLLAGLVATISLHLTDRHHSVWTAAVEGKPPAVEGKPPLVTLPTLLT